MAEASMEMVRDVLEWDMSDYEKIAIIEMLMEAPIPAVKKRIVDVSPQPSKRRHVATSRGTTHVATGAVHKVKLWAQCKKADPEGAKKLDYSYVKNEELEKFLAAAKKRK